MLVNYERRIFFFFCDFFVNSCEKSKCHILFLFNTKIYTRTCAEILQNFVQQKYLLLYLIISIIRTARVRECIVKQ